MSRPRRRRARRRLRVLVLLETGRAPPEDVDALSDQERYEFKMEIDVLATLRTLGHEARVSVAPVARHSSFPRPRSGARGSCRRCLSLKTASHVCDCCRQVMKAPKASRYSLASTAMR